jgi:hypothetical protein
VIDGLGSLSSLKELNLSGNNIETIGTGLDDLERLEELNLSNNKIGNFKELLNLNRLPQLKSSTFYDPHYGENPICNLCNYQVTFATKIRHTFYTICLICLNLTL